MEYLEHIRTLRNRSKQGKEKTSDQKVGGSNPSRHAVYYQTLTTILAARRKSVFAIGLPLLGRKVSHGYDRHGWLFWLEAPRWNRVSQNTR